MATLDRPAVEYRTPADLVKDVKRGHFAYRRFSAASDGNPRTSQSYSTASTVAIRSATSFSGVIQHQHNI